MHAPRDIETAVMLSLASQLLHKPGYARLRAFALYGAQQMRRRRLTTDLAPQQRLD